MPKRRVIIANTDEPRAGDYAYQLYDKAHPVYGDPETIAYLRQQLKGMRGELVTFSVKGSHIDEEGRERRFTVRRTFRLNRYADVFGPGSAYASAIHFIRDKYSDQTLVTHSMIVEEASDDYEDYENDDE